VKKKGWSGFLLSRKTDQGERQKKTGQRPDNGGLWIAFHLLIGNVNYNFFSGKVSKRICFKGMRQTDVGELEKNESVQWGASIGKKKNFTGTGPVVAVDTSDKGEIEAPYGGVN